MGMKGVEQGMMAGTEAEAYVYVATEGSVD